MSLVLDWLCDYVFSFFVLFSAMVSIPALHLSLQVLPFSLCTQNRGIFKVIREYI